MMRNKNELLEQQSQILQQVRLMLIAVSNCFLSECEVYENLGHKDPQDRTANIEMGEHSHSCSGLQAFSQDLKSGHPKCAIGSAQMNNV